MSEEIDNEKIVPPADVVEFAKLRDLLMSIETPSLEADNSNAFVCGVMEVITQAAFDISSFIENQGGG